MIKQGEESDSKRLIVILGMARSGTSVISRGVKALGVDLGTALSPGSKWNPTGFWEDHDIVYKINEQILKKVGIYWDSTRAISKAELQNSTLDELKFKACAIIKKRLSQKTMWGFKDPRTARLLPFWQNVFQTLGVHESYVIALRNPLSSALSYQRLTDADVEHGLILWVLHLIAAVNETHGKQRVIVNYDTLMKNPRQQLTRLQSELHLDHLENNNTINHYIDSFLDKNLTHFEYKSQDLEIHPATKVSPVASQVYSWLLKIAHDEITFDDKNFQIAWQDIQHQLHVVLPFYDLIDTLLRRHKTLKTYTRQLHKSRLWKIIYPLRKFDETLRTWRKRNGEKKLLGPSE
ncbi:MAG: hypothetical protein H0W64_01655 [Gammaproteobacteria bacterium]|nr:hypothetical protein [Gammaproteobacteria bacterium]